MIMHASICHNDDDHTDPKHRRVKLHYTNQINAWFDSNGRAVCHVPTGMEPAKALEAQFGDPHWDLRID